MNFIQKNPNDPKYQEFHDGEYEYWPLDHSTKTRSISIPAALVSGLELLAAVAAAGLLAVALSVFYVLSSPLKIDENSALINISIYNNSAEHSVSYTLSASNDPAKILQEGTLQHDEKNLSLQDLDGGVTYLLTYYGPDRNAVGQFQFTTTGQKQEPDSPTPSSPAETPPVVTEPATERTDTTEPETQAPDETVPSETEPEGGIGGGDDTVDELPVPVPKPKPTGTPEPEGGIGGGDDQEDDPPVPAPNPEPPTEPTNTTEPETETEPKPTLPPMEALPPEVEEFVYTDPYDPYFSGITDDAYFEITEVYIFKNIPADHSITVLQNGHQHENFRSDLSADGTLTVTVYGNPVHYGETMKTSVTVNSGSNSIEQESTFTPPYLQKEATLDMSKQVLGTTDDEGNPYIEYTFTITAYTRDDSDERIVCEAELYTGLGDDPILLALQETSPRTYVGTHTVTSTKEPEEPPFANIRGYWAQVPEGTYYQEAFALYDPS